ncbi:unnamed protein product [Adineta steineri]|uniref:CUB domain-containing protein n=1 Tax=Adineta steineri TaxID=433720 RepID=A0A814W014_9BILA|nr:unnamed protein product [Adineta steineri]CAF1039948.1 unnamed protein product [Adineta steineri]CAF1194333.1 unnamed protein product [Adineta steineri]CAF3748986.1 unnamed protein product [Adineta steineri]CAF3946488.1 unnamed protein product [Adineta steineri]
MAIISRFSTLTTLCLLILIIQTNAGKATEKFFMDKMCGQDHLVLDGDKRPGISFQLTNSNKYKSNTNCTVKFRTAQPSQRIVITVEKMDIADCPSDTLLIYDGTTLLNKNANQQCGSPAFFTFTTSTTQVSITFKSNSAVESSGFQMAIALHFPTVPACPQNLGFYQCKNRNCISKQLKCDGRNHCGDSTDENECSLISH